jgi:hypothetical protein
MPICLPTHNIAQALVAVLTREKVVDLDGDWYNLARIFFLRVFI